MDKAARVREIKDSILEGHISVANLFGEEILKDLFSEAELNELREKIERIKSLNTQLGALEKIAQELNVCRKDLISKFEKLENDQILGGTNCPLCGFDWNSNEQLLQQFAAQEKAIEKLYVGVGNDLEIILSNVHTTYLEKIETVINDWLKVNENKLQKAFFEKLEISEKHKDFIKTFTQWLDKHSLAYQQFLVNDPTSFPSDLEERTRKFSDFLKSKQVEVDTSNLKANFKSIYREFFNQDAESVGKITVKQISDKISYLRNQYLLSSNKRLSNLQGQIEEFDQKDLRLSTAIGELDNIRLKIEKAIKTYQGRVMKDIEIPFYIYSGRILQSHQVGTGLFIMDNGDELKRIKFQTKPNSSHDALFSLSSGQLMALVLSFSLALNKIYANNCLLLIDDPIQTMDEVNISSLTELLRNEFDNNQMIISTHEDDISMYMRYKFQKYNLKTKRVNIKQEVFKLIE